MSEIEAALLSGEVILSAEVDRFERAFAGHTGAAHALGVNSGTDALILALRSAGHRPRRRGDHGGQHLPRDRAGHRRTGATPVLADARRTTT